MEEGSQGSDGLEVVAEALATLRERLLDLTGRNKLLNFRHSSAGCLRIVDEVPDQLFETLMGGGAFMFDPVPMPSKAQILQYNAQALDLSSEETEQSDPTPPSSEKWARHLGIDTSYDLPVEYEEERARRHSDKKLQSLHYSDPLEARLKKLRANARLAIEETGTNFLHLALGFLEWSDPKQSDKAWQAPLILIPAELVRERERSGKYRFRLSWTGEDLQPNLSLQKKLNDDFGIELPEFEEGEQPEAYFRKIQDRINDHPGWGVSRYATLSLFQFGKILLYKDLDPEIWPDGHHILANPLVRSLVLGYDGGDFGGEKRPEPDPAEIDLTLELIDRADSSQAGALIHALSGKSMVVQGPPGTGKSQTITNLIAAALARGKKVLFVSEKLAALEVVRRRLEEAELGDFVLELHSHKTRKLALLEDLKRRAERNYPAPQKLTRERDRLVGLRADIEQYVHAVGDSVGEFGWPVSDVLFEAGRQMLRKSEQDIPDFPSTFLTCESATEADRHRAHLDIDEFLRVLGVAARGQSPAAHPWAGISSEKILGALDENKVVDAGKAWEARLGDLNVACKAALAALGRTEPPGDSDLDDLQRIVEARGRIESLRDNFEPATSLAERVTSGLGLRIEDPASSVLITGKVAQAIATVPDEIGALNRDFAEQDNARSLTEQSMTEYRQIEEEIADLEGELRFSEAETIGSARLAEDATKLESAGFFARFFSTFKTARTTFTALSKGTNFDRLRAAQTLKSAVKTIERKQAFCANLVMAKVANGSYEQASADLGNTARLIDWLETIRGTFGSGFSDLGHVGKALYRLPAAELRDLQKLLSDDASLNSVATCLEEAGCDIRLEGTAGSDPMTSAVAVMVPEPYVEIIASSPDTQLTAIFKAAVDALEKSSLESETRSAFEDLTGLNRDQSHFATGPYEDRSLALSEALAQADRLTEWLELDRAVRATRDADFNQLIDAVFTGSLKPDQAKTAYDHALFDGLARLAVEKHPILKQINVGTQDELRARYRDLDAQIMDLQARQIASVLGDAEIPDGNQSPRVRELTEMNLIRHEMGKKRAHLPIRRLLERSGRALLELKPCFMMGPLSVAQYLRPGEVEFDLLIFDEASQLKPEEAIGALARARQVIVVGDSNQLPPTSFFDKIGSADDDEDAFVAESPSILDVAEKQLPKEMLRWHYRSQHPDLIRFSNERFYDGRMVLFPSPRRHDERLGVSFHFVPDTNYASGRNEVEAEAVAREVVKHLRERPQESIGVVAMNSEQRDLLDLKIDEILRDDIELRERAEDLSNRNEPFFVKNLENVQGDERDVIVISMTYGPGQDSGRVMQRFGPINSDDGWRRLNVLFSRSKRRMVVFSSMKEGDIKLTETTKRGVRELRNFLRFAESGMIDGTAEKTGRHPDSDFEIAVMESLKKAGFQCEPQVGAMGFFVDVGVVDPDDASSFVIGVECDGATYHSSRSARDRDRLRQEVLENMGWAIERVWSTDWFRDPERELARVVDVINSQIEFARVKREKDATRRAQEADQPSQVLVAELIETDQQDADDVITLTFEEHDAPIELPDLSAPAPQAIENSTPDAKRLPDYGLSVEDARRELIDLRDEIAPEIPEAELANGLLRRAMISELLAKRPLDEDEFRLYVRQSLREDTAPGQLAKYGARVFEILDRIRS